ncbi:MAG: BMFP domain-containing protein YqiC [Kiritimatiellia bacterium]
MDLLSIILRWRNPLFDGLTLGFLRVTLVSGRIPSDSDASMKTLFISAWLLLYSCLCAVAAEQAVPDAPADGPSPASVAANEVDQKIQRLSRTDLVDLALRQREEIVALRQQLHEQREQRAKLMKLMEQMSSAFKTLNDLSK